MAAVGASSHPLEAGAVFSVMGRMVCINIENDCFIIVVPLSFDFWYRYLHPIYYGDYPEIMRKSLGDRLPKFTKEEKELVRSSLNFVGLNHYTSRFIAYATNSPEEGNFYKAQEMERIGIITTFYYQIFIADLNSY